MVEQSKIQRTTSRSRWITVGILLMVVLMGASGCSQSKAATAQATDQGQPPQGKGQRVRNPALQAAMEIRRLQSDQKNVLTTDQKTKIKPILQELIKTTTLSQAELQQKADAINAVLTDQQKSSLTTPKNSNGNNQNATTSKGGSTKGNYPQGGGGNGARQGGSASNPQVMYQQILDSLK